MARFLHASGEPGKAGSVENGQPSRRGSARTRARRSGAPTLRAGPGRQREEERRAAVRRALCPDAPAVLLDDALDDAETHARARLVADYIAGMTDRYALDEHRRLFDLYE